MSKNNNLLDQEIAILITNAMIGTGIIGLPRLLAESAGPDGLWALCASLVITSFGLYLITRLVHKFPNESITKYSPKLLGKPLGLIFNIIFAIYLIGTAAAVLRSASDTVSVIILRRTPIEVIMITMLIATAALARNGIQSIARALQIIFFLFFTHLLLIPLLWPIFDFGEFLPIFYTDGAGFLSAMRSALFSILGFETVLLIISPYAMNKKHLFPASITGFIIAGFIAISLVVMSFGTLSVDQTATFDYPIFEMVKFMPMPLLILERVELFFFSVWIASTYSTIVIQLFTASQHIAEMVNINNGRHFVWPACIVIFFLARLPPNVYARSKVLDNFNYGFVVLLFVIIPLFLLLATIRQPKANNKKKKIKAGKKRKK